MKKIVLLLLAVVILAGCEKVKNPFNNTDRKTKMEAPEGLYAVTLYSSMGAPIRTYIGKGKINEENNGQILVFRDKDGKQHRISGGIVDIEYGN